jgi:hypothetical protein
VKGTETTDILKERFGKADLGVLLWPADSGGADPIPQWLRQNDFQPLPLLVVWPGSDRKEVIESSLSGWRCVLLPAGESQDPSRIAKAFKSLEIQFRDYDLELAVSEEDPFTTGSLESFGRRHLECSPSCAVADLRKLGRQYLEHIIQRFFPEDKTVKIHPVGGGWSGDSLCRVHVGPKQQEHFIKFYSDKKKYEDEFKNHLDAQAILKEHTVTLKRVPDLGEENEPQAEAFPAETKPPVYPICFESAAEGDTGLKMPKEGDPSLKTLKGLYAVWTDDSMVDKAIDQLLTVVPAQFDPANQKRQAPWGYDKGNKFRLTGELKRSILDAISDLNSYGPAVCGEDWSVICGTVKNLVYQGLTGFPWLEGPRYVAMGYIHGDPNSRNCFFDEKDPAQLKLIDCGDFTDKGRLVSDLAMIERELKIVLMGTNPTARGYFDLDAWRLSGAPHSLWQRLQFLWNPRRLSGAPHPLAWCAAEKASITKGLAYKKEDAERDLAADPSVLRVYRAVASVRARAKGASGDFDPGGSHYFAALLYWTLDILKEPAVRRTKKLLAIYSAAQILGKKFP